MGALTVVQHNMLSMFSNRQLGITSKKKDSSVEKLSSGYKINRSADDAAGLSISEKMRLMVRGLDQGSSNIMDGVSMIKVADGALAEVHEMLQRMNELTIKGLNGTLSHEDRQSCQQEIDALYDEICRIGDTTAFNELYVLQGNPLVPHVTAEERQKTVITTEEMAPAMPSAYVSISNENFTKGGAGSINQKTPDGKAYRTVDNETGEVLDSLDGKAAGTYHTETNSNWSPEMTDNYGTYLDFTNLANATGQTITDNPDGSRTVKNDLYSALFKFVGTGFYTTCDTCNDQYNIMFIDNRGGYEFRADSALTKVENNIRYYDDNYGANVYINISDLLEESQKASLSADDVKDITKRFVQRIVSQGNSDYKVRNHYTRYAIGDDPYKLAIYDFRDYVTDTDSERYGYVKPPDPDKGYGKVGNLQGILKIYGQEAYVENMEYLAREPLYIHHGGGSFERRSKVELPLLEGIFECYRKFGYTSVKQSLTLEEEYPARSYAAPGTTIASIRTIPAHKETRQKLVDTIVHDPLYIAGELVKPGYTEPVYTTETVDVPEKTYTSYEYLPGGQVYEEASYGPLNEGMIAVVEDLIKQVSEIRAGLGADQNRLERAYLINQNVLENTQSAESTIRDTDMAEEIMRFSRENILQQAGQSMLAQANSQQQQVLSLLQQ